MMSYKGIKITLKNGEVDFIDPAEYVEIDNGECVYTYLAKDIDKIETYEESEE